MNVLYIPLHSHWPQIPKLGVQVCLLRDGDLNPGGESPRHDPKGSSIPGGVEGTEDVAIPSEGKSAASALDRALIRFHSGTTPAALTSLCKLLRYAC